MNTTNMYNLSAFKYDGEKLKIFANEKENTIKTFVRPGACSVWRFVRFCDKHTVFACQEDEINISSYENLPVYLTGFQVESIMNCVDAGTKNVAVKTKSVTNAREIQRLISIHSECHRMMYEVMRFGGRASQKTIDSCIEKYKMYQKNAKKIAHLINTKFINNGIDKVFLN